MPIWPSTPIPLFLGPNYQQPDVQFVILIGIACDFSISSMRYDGLILIRKADFLIGNAPILKKNFGA